MKNGEWKMKNGCQEEPEGICFLSSYCSGVNPMERGRRVLRAFGAQCWASAGLVPVEP